jgi:hypothetical protein
LDPLIQVRILEGQLELRLCFGMFPTDTIPFEVTCTVLPPS